MHFTRVDRAYIEVHNIPMVMSFLWQGSGNINDLLLDGQAYRSNTN